MTPEELTFLRSLDSPTLSNAIERLNVRDRTDGYVGGSVRCMSSELGPMVGEAVTATMTSRVGRTASRDGYWRLWEHVARGASPTVLVVQDISESPTRCAYIGEVMATLALGLGCIGFVTDGGVRDLPELRAVGFHLFARWPVVSHGNFEVVDVGCPVVIDGQRIENGDILHGDSNGIVLIPPVPHSEIEAAVEQIRKEEEELIDYYRSPGLTVAEARKRAGY